MKNRPNKRSRSADQILEQLELLLDQFDPDEPYPRWVTALMVCYHATFDSQDGFDLADAWSSKGRKYRGTQDVRKAWNSFKIDHPNPVGIGTLIRMINDGK